MSQIIAGNPNAYGTTGVPPGTGPPVPPATMAPQIQPAGINGAQIQPLLQEPNNNNSSSKLAGHQWNSEPIVDSTGGTSAIVCNCASFLDPFPNQITWR